MNAHSRCINAAAVCAGTGPYLRLAGKGRWQAVTELGAAPAGMTALTTRGALLTGARRVAFVAATAEHRGVAQGAASADSPRPGVTGPAPGTADPSGWQWQVRDAFIIATLVAAAACAERLDVARATVASVRAAGGNTAATGPPWWLWLAVTAIGVTAAWLAIARAAEVVGSLTAPANARHFADLARIALALWGLWQVAGLAAAVGAGVPSALLAVLHLGAYTVAAIALVGAGRALVGDPAAAWRRTSFVRIELIVLAAIFAVMLLASLTAAQVVDVLRAWGDGSPARAVVGLSAALLLGAVCRAGAYRMLVPRRIRKPYARPGRNRPGALARYWALVVVPLLAVAAGSAAIGAPLGVAAAVVFLAVGAVTRWATPIPGTRCVTCEPRQALAASGGHARRRADAHRLRRARRRDARLIPASRGGLVGRREAADRRRRRGRALRLAVRGGPQSCNRDPQAPPLAPWARGIGRRARRRTGAERAARAARGGARTPAPGPRALAGRQARLRRRGRAVGRRRCRAGHGGRDLRRSDRRRPRSGKHRPRADRGHGAPGAAARRGQPQYAAAPPGARGGGCPTGFRS